MRKIKLLCSILLGTFIHCHAQQYTGMTGLIHAPSAEMNAAGTAMVGAHFLNKEFTPDVFTYQGKYHTMSHYLNITPFSWIELGYTCTLQKGKKNAGKSDHTSYYYKDRYFSLKLNPLTEGKWHPAIAVGTNDPYSSSDGGGETGDGQNRIFSNYYISATKHFSISGNRIGIHASYRKYKRAYNSKWDGIVGGVTFRPSFAPDLRIITEYNGNDVNAGIDCLLWKHLFIQGSLQKGKYFTGGLCYRLNLL